MSDGASTGRNTAGLRPPWKPGESGNKSGRPKMDPKVREYLDAKTLPAVKRLWRLCKNTDPYVALGALKVFLAKRLPDVKAGIEDGEAATAEEAISIAEARAMANLKPEPPPPPSEDKH